MTLLNLPTRELLDSLADEFLHSYGRGRTLLAVDGTEVAGTTGFADDLATRLGRGGHPVFRARVENFHRPRAQRYQAGVDSAEGYYRDSFDYDLLARVLIDPFRLAGSAGFVTAAFDLQRDTPIEMQWQTGPPDATLIVDGVFLNRPELRGLWNYTVWLELSPEEEAARWLSHSRGAASSARFAGGQALYQAQANPRARATAIVDNTDPQHPRRVFADSC